MVQRLFPRRRLPLEGAQRTDHGNRSTSIPRTAHDRPRRAPSRQKRWRANAKLPSPASLLVTRCASPDALSVCVSTAPRAATASSKSLRLTAAGTRSPSIPHSRSRKACASPRWPHTPASSTELLRRKQGSQSKRIYAHLAWPPRAARATRVASSARRGATIVRSPCADGCCVRLAMRGNLKADRLGLGRCVRGRRECPLVC